MLEYGSFMNHPIFLGLLLIVLSMVAVPSLILSKKPNAKELLDKIAPFQGWAGVFFCFWGLWNLIWILMHFEIMRIGMWGILLWATYLAYAAITCILGFMLGYNLIVEYVLSKNEKTAEKGVRVQAKLAEMQGIVGILGVIIGLWMIILFFILKATWGF
ncbi:MAG: hypothetical protein LBG19_00580 [Prevotellaceae bacterium]|jgi:hypothetical protein|nr:hypothetical protein [Prevotellaceae bacterium]